MLSRGFIFGHKGQEKQEMVPAMSVSVYQVIKLLPYIQVRIFRDLR